MNFLNNRIALIFVFAFISSLGAASVPSLRRRVTQNRQPIVGYSEISTSTQETVLIAISKKEITTSVIHVQMIDMEFTTISCSGNQCLLGTTDKSVHVSDYKPRTRDEKEFITFPSLSFKPYVSLKDERVVSVTKLDGTDYFLQCFNGRDGIFLWNLGDPTQFSRYRPTFTQELTKSIQLRRSAIFIFAYRNAASLQAIDVSTMTGAGKINLSGAKAGVVDLIYFPSPFIINGNKNKLSTHTFSLSSESNISDYLDLNQEIADLAVYENTGFIALKTLNNQIQIFSVISQGSIEQVFEMELDPKFNHTEKILIPMTYSKLGGQILIPLSPTTIQELKFSYDQDYKSPTCASSRYYTSFSFTSSGCTSCTQIGSLTNNTCYLKESNGGLRSNLTSTTIFKAKFQKNEENIFFDTTTCLFILFSLTGVIVVFLFYLLICKKPNQEEDNQTNINIQLKNKENPFQVKKIENFGCAEFIKIENPCDLPNVVLSTKGVNKFPPIINIDVLKIISTKIQISN